MKIVEQYTNEGVLIFETVRPDGTVVRYDIRDLGNGRITLRIAGDHRIMAIPVTANKLEIGEDGD